MLYEYLWLRNSLHCRAWWVLSTAKERKEEGVMQLCLPRKYDWNPFVFCSSFRSLGYVCFTWCQGEIQSLYFISLTTFSCWANWEDKTCVIWYYGPVVSVHLHCFFGFFLSAERFSLIFFYYYSNRNIYRICRVAKWMLQLESYTFMVYFKLQS